MTLWEALEDIPRVDRAGKYNISLFWVGLGQSSSEAPYKAPEGLINKALKDVIRP